jgi:hypothetical protein
VLIPDGQRHRGGSKRQYYCRFLSTGDAVSSTRSN